MKEWIKANGGPAAIVILGISLTTWKSTEFGIVIIILGVFYLIYKMPLFPYTKILNKKDAAFVAKTDKEIVEKARGIVRSLGALLGQHVRYRPPFHDEHDDLSINPHASWVRNVN